MTAEQHTSIAHSDGDTPRVDEIDPDLEAYKRAYVMAINYSTGNFGEKFREVEQRLNRRLARTTPDEQVQIDNAVEDLVITMLVEMAEWSGEYIDSDSPMARKLYEKFRKDLASAGIRLTYDTPIGGE